MQRLRPFDHAGTRVLPRSPSRGGERHEGRHARPLGPDEAPPLAREIGPPLLCLCGPTGTGKSRLAVELALRLGGEIVGCDALQVYRGLDAGTAKPTPSEREQVPHWMIDVADPRRDYSLADYVRDADQAIASIVSRGGVPIVAGGTGMYLRGLLKGIVPAPPRNEELRARLSGLNARFGAPRLHRWLRSFDPVSAERIRQNDTQRVVRALEIALSAGVTWSATIARAGTWSGERLRYRATTFGLDLDREVLAERLAARVDAFFEAGLPGEIERLLAAGVPRTANAFKGIGYREILEAKAAGRDPDDARDAIVVATRQYAKRQRTWFRKEPGLVWLDAAQEVARLADAVIARWSAALSNEGASSAC